MIRTVRTILLATVLAGAIAPLGAEERVLMLTPESTDVRFDLEATGHDVHGVLQLVRGEVRFDEASGEASGEIVLDAGSAVTGNSRRDRTMREDVLEIARFPEIRFVPRRLVGRLGEAGESRITLEGSVWLHGDEHALALPARVRRNGDRVSIETAFPIPYEEWGLENPSILFLRVARVVGVVVSAEATVSDSGPVAAGG